MALCGQSILILVTLTTAFSLVACGSFTIDYANNTYLKDGQPFRYISGSIHYNRVPRIYWKDRLLKMYAMGLNAIQTYVPWNAHQPYPFMSDFSGNLDLVSFLQLAQDIGFVVILRPGPYTDAGWDFGGLAAWLMESRFVNNNITLRTNDAVYMYAVDQWFADLLPRVRPLLYQNGGPVVALQVENEYGSYYACDHDYMHSLRDIIRFHLGDDVVLFSTDGAMASLLKCGTIEGVYATVDFGLTDNPQIPFSVQRMYEPKGPLVCSEFYVESNLEYWGINFTTQSPQAAAKSLDSLLAYGANVNMYMLEGGTNFGYTSASILEGKKFMPVATTYDHDAPLSEAGDPRAKYYALREVILKYVQPPSIPVPPAIPKFAYGEISFQKLGTVTDLISANGTDPVTFTYPVCMEDIQQYHGFAVYRHVATLNYISKELQVDGLRDSGYVIVNGDIRGILRRGGQTRISIDLHQYDVLEILVENQGHDFFGDGISHSQKGIIQNVTLGGQILTNWTIYPINVNSLASEALHSSTDAENYRFTGGTSSTALQTPAVYVGMFQVPRSLPEPLDTYMDMRPWHKGQLFINEYNIGSYWPSLGPQVTLYVPKSVLKPYPENNTVVVLELEYSPCLDQKPCSANFVDKPFINKTVTMQF